MALWWNKRLWQERGRGQQHLLRYEADSRWSPVHVLSSLCRKDLACSQCFIRLCEGKINVRVAPLGTGLRRINVSDLFPPSDHLIYTLCPHYYSSFVEVWVSEPVLLVTGLPQTGERRCCPSLTNTLMLKNTLFIFKMYLPTTRADIGHVSRSSWHKLVTNTSISNS